MTAAATTKITKSPEETKRLAGALCAKLGPGAVVALYGELGAGKTCFIQGLAEELGVEQAVSSPTFTIINEYKTQPPLYHVDLYRIHGEDEALGLGLDEYLYGDGITAIEWAERVEGLLPPGTVRIHLDMGSAPQERTITIEGA